MHRELLRIGLVVCAVITCANAAEPRGRWYDGRNWIRDKELKRHLIYWERPIYPMSARIGQKSGSGLFWMHFDKTGRVTAVKIVESTKQPDLDNAVVYAFYHWRCRPGEVDQAIVPVTFNLLHSRIGGHVY